MTREEKKQARVERYEQMAAKAKQESNSLYEQSKKMSDAIPFGQPILVGHHSERADQRYRGRMWDKMEKSVKADEKAAYYERKAAAAENNDNIYLEDEDAVKRLTEKIERLKKLQEMIEKPHIVDEMNRYIVEEFQVKTMSEHAKEIKSLYKKVKN